MNPQIKSITNLEKPVQANQSIPNISKTTLPPNATLLAERHHNDLNQKKQFRNTIATLLLFLMFLASSFGLLYVLANRQVRINNIFSNVDFSNDPNGSVLSSERCNETSNVLTSTVPLVAYDRVSYFASSLDPSLAKGTIPAGQEMYIDFLEWQNDTENVLSYKGKAMVCLKDQNKSVTVEFNTYTSKIKNLLRYKDTTRSIKNILVQAIYAIPTGAIVHNDWQNKISSNLLNIQKAQQRIFNNQSNIDFQIYPVVVNITDINRDFLTQVAKGIVSQSNAQNSYALKPKDFLDNNIYTDANLKEYPSFFNKALSGQDTKQYDQISSLVYLEVGGNTKNSAQKYESGYAFTGPALLNGNFFGIIGMDLSQDISTNSESYHEFMHTLGLPDEYKYETGKLQRVPTHLFKGQPQSFPTLMENPYSVPLSKTYIDDQERVLMGIHDE